MEFIKAQLWTLSSAVAALLAIGLGTWFYLGGGEINAQLQKLDQLKNQVQQVARGAANRSTVEAVRQESKLKNEAISKAAETAMTPQKNSAFHCEDLLGPLNRPRTPLMEGVLPVLQSSGQAIRFRDSYKTAVAALVERLKGRSGPTPDEIKEEIDMERYGRGSQEEEEWPDPWWPPNVDAGGKQEQQDAEIDSREAYIPRRPQSRVAERIARSIYMYVDDGAFGIHPLALDKGHPAVEEIWQAQMALWIQQDLAAALAACNELRAAELSRAGRDDDRWVAHMPVKHLRRVMIGDALGNGGGQNVSNTRRDPTQLSFTGIVNSQDLFMVPLQLDLVVEQQAIPMLMDQLARIGYYSPVSLDYQSVEANHFQDGMIYGDDPVVTVTLDLEGYCFRAAFEEWIPESLKEVMKMPGARETASRGGGRGGRP